MTLGDAIKNLKYDKRLTLWNINQGNLTAEELKKHLDSLPDLGKNVELMTMSEERPSSEAH